MIVSEYLDSIQGTEKEQQLFKGLEILNKEDVTKALEIPIVGKMLRSAVALANAESIAAYKETEYYEQIKDWGITVFDLEKGMISIHPGPKHMKKAIPVLAVLGVALLALILWKVKKNYRKRKNR